MCVSAESPHVSLSMLSEFLCRVKAAESDGMRHTGVVLVLAK